MIFTSLLIAIVAGQDCTLQVPTNPLTAQGLSTPYILSGAGCTQTLKTGQTFVEAAILDVNTGAITIYHPLVIDAGTKPAVPPVIPILPAGAQVGIWFGTNANTLTLAGPGLGSCVNGAPNSIFGQFAYCNAGAFFSAANTLIAAGTLVIPPIGTGLDRNPCPTTRDFRLVDQDQSDNLETQYLLLNGQVAQNTAANRVALAGAMEIDNGSDNRLLGHFFGPALGCTPFMAPSADDPGAMINALALNELSAAANQLKPVALVPINDPMVLINTKPSLVKTNLYRVGVDQPIAAKADDNQADTTDNASGVHYCVNLVNGIAGFNTPQAIRLLTGFTTPDPATGTNLFTFLASRSSAALGLLNCLNLLKIANPWTLTLDGNGVTIAAVFTKPRLNVKKIKRTFDLKRIRRPSLPSVYS